MDNNSQASHDSTTKSVLKGLLLEREEVTTHLEIAKAEVARLSETRKEVDNKLLPIMEENNLDQINHLGNIVQRKQSVVYQSLNPKNIRLALNSYNNSHLDVDDLMKHLINSRSSKTSVTLVSKKKKT